MSTFTAGTELTADMLNALEKPVARFRRTTDIGSITTTEVEWGSVTLSAPRPNSEYVVKCGMKWGGGAVDQLWIARIRETSIAGTDRSGNVVRSEGGSPYWSHWEYPFNTGAAPAAQTFLGTLIRSGGAGTATVQINSWMLIELVGTTSEMVTA